MLHFFKPTRDAFLFVFFLLAIDFLGAHLLVSQVYIDRETIAKIISEGRLTIFWFILRLFVISIILMLILSFIERLLKIKYKFAFYGPIAIYIFFFLEIKNPQIFDDLILNSLLPGDRSHWDSKLIYFLSFALIFALNFQLFFQLRKGFLKHSGFYFANAIIVIFLISNYLTLQSKPEIAPHYQAINFKGKVSKDIIAIVVDSFPSDKEYLFEQSANKSFLDFLKTGKSFKNLISDLPETYPAVYSFLAGKASYQTGKRHAYIESSRQEFESLSKLKKSGYEVHLITDGIETGAFSKSPFIDSVESPHLGFETSFISKIFYSKLFHGFFDNVIGQLFFPNLFHNNAFPFSYDSNQTAHRNIKILDSLLKENAKPKFILFHIGYMQQPGVWRYPYYPKVGNTNFKFGQFSYLSEFSFIPSEKLTNVGDREKLNNEVFLGGVKSLTIEILNPLFNYLKETGVLTNSNVILFSSHGENLWEKGDDFPKIKIPYHGDSLLSASNSERAYFKASLKDEAKIDPEDSIAISSLLGYLFLKEPLSRQPIYVETGFNPFNDFIGILKMTTKELLIDFMHIDSKSGAIYLESTADKFMMLDKQRAIIDGRYRYTVFPTYYGRKKFLCDLKEDPRCFSNLNDPILNRRFFLELKNIYTHDLVNDEDFEPTDSIDPDRNKNAIETAFRSNNEWIRTYAYMISFFKFHDFEFALQHIYSIYTSTKDLQLAKFIKRNAVMFCTDQKDLNALVGKIIFSNNIGNYAPILVFPSYLKAMDRFSPNRSPQMNFNRSFMSFQSLYPEYYFRPPNGNEHLGRAKIESLLEDLNNKFKIKLSYNLEEETEAYFYIKFHLISQMNLDEAFIKIFKEITIKPTSAAFELQFLNYIEAYYKIPKMTISNQARDAVVDRRKMRISNVLKFFKQQNM